MNLRWEVLLLSIQQAFKVNQTLRVATRKSSFKNLAALVFDYATFERLQ